MAPDFDPYHQWLGIPPKEQPANHYRLLGVTLLETNRDVIAVAANRQMSYLQELATGPDVAEAQKLLSEISQARACLLNAKQKAVYDQQLRSVLPAVETEEPEEEAQQHVAVQRPDEARSARPARSRSGTARRPAPRASSSSKQNHNLPLLITVAGGTAVAVAVLIVLLLGGSGKSKKTNTDEKPTVSKKSPEGNGIPLPGGEKQKPKPKPAPLKPKPKPTPPGPAKSKPESQQKPAPKKPKPVSTPAPDPPGDDGPEAAAAGLLQSKGLEEGFNGTWEHVELTTAYEEANNASPNSSSAAVAQKIERRLLEKKKTIVREAIKIAQSEARPNDLTEPMGRLMGISNWMTEYRLDWGFDVDGLQYMDTPGKAEYQQYNIVAIPFDADEDRIREEVHAEMGSPSTGPSPALQKAAHDLADAYAALQADEEVQAALETVDGTLAEPPDDVASTEQAPAGQPDAQVAGSDNASDEAHAQPPREANSTGGDEAHKQEQPTPPKPDSKPVATKTEGKAPSQPDATFDELKKQLTAAEIQTKIDYVKFNKEVKEYIKKRKELVNAIGPLQRLVKQLQQKLDATPEGERKVAIGQQIEAGPMKKLKELQQKLSGLPKPNPAQLEAGLATAGKLIEKIRGKPEYAENESSIEKLVTKIEKTQKALAGAQRKLAKKPK